MKNVDGCWTCRLRRKKCDEATPTCLGCSSLDIDCYYGEVKPQWMDGAQKQKDMVAKVKADIRTSAARRRELSASEANPDKMEFTLVLDSTPLSRKQKRSIPRREAVSSVSSSHDASMQADLPFGPDDEAYGPVSAQQINNEYLMLYLDHFFQFLFPFYRPSLLEGGRGWLLQLIATNRPLYHTTLSITACFLSVAHFAASMAERPCNGYALDELSRRASISFASLQQDLQNLHQLDSDDRLVRQACIMDSIVYLQRFETLISNSEHFLIHLNAAVELFNQILSENDPGAAEDTPFDTILRRLTRPLWSGKILGTPWTSDQAGFRFFTALLIVDDIVASTALNVPPRLQRHHQALLTNIDALNARPAIDLQDFVGCQNWIMLQLANVSALAAEKHIAKQAGTLDMTKIVADAKGIKDILLDGLSHLTAPTPEPKKSNILDLFASRYQANTLPADSILVTRAWAHATLAYLSVVVSGWQPAHPEIRENVSRVLEFMTQAQTQTQTIFRSMFWPFCVAGCLAEPRQQERVREMVEKLEPRRLFGTVSQALEMMEVVWRQHDAQPDPGLRDLAMFFGALGQPLVPV
ncbi:hypothetical protein LTR91_023810 [Friedmanniomyces endolithicus]|uniref:Zn(2)-C6 fungal-type domain-containing protein n=1 Tax=Friedmanniomyces endolithicus TaxID=329885 RepID=A0AAN6H1L0_9PEZI|nr:hypothetical protein LTR94_014282 [Friedmanniomyces endolithicus]KAK0797340.1 hypothetical protein LTR38_008243 [Friedmanniomyces endolithicus]KAK0953503.1 hypothetical protein LTR91_023810 [Friedmanniomyces endolithicus]